MALCYVFALLIHDLQQYFLAADGHYFGGKETLSEFVQVLLRRTQIKILYLNQSNSSKEIVIPFELV